MVRSTLSRAVFAPKRCGNPMTAMTESLMSSLLLGVRPQGGVALAQQIYDLVDFEAELAGLGDQRVDAFRRDAQPLPARQRGASVGNIRAGCAAFDDDACRLPFAISAGHGVR